MQKPENSKSDTIICYIIVVILVCVWIFNTCSISDEKKIDSKQTIENKITNQFSAWNGYHRGLVRLTEEHLKDPDSFQHINTRHWKNLKDGVFVGTITVVMEYRAKNSFGGYVIGNIAAVYDIEGNLVKIEGTF